MVCACVLSSLSFEMIQKDGEILFAIIIPAAHTYGTTDI